MPKVDLFKVLLPSLMVTKKYQFDEEGAEQSYIPSIVNRALSYYPDCLFLANEMNLMRHLSRRSQYEFYLHAVEARRRTYTQWAKKNLDDENVLNAVKRFFNYSSNEAKEVIPALTATQIQEILNIDIPK